VSTTDELEQMLGDSIRALRVSRQFTRAELADRANVSLGALRNLETGAGATITTLVKTLRALDSTAWLSSLTPPPEAFDPLRLLAAREEEQRRTRGPRRVRHPR
jgi:transcriptional regulator with XRE-family HTH domain